MKITAMEDLVSAYWNLREARAQFRKLDDCDVDVRLFDGNGDEIIQVDIQDWAIDAAIKDHIRIKLAASIDEATKALTAAGIDLPDEEPEDEEDEGEDEQEAA